MLDDTNTKYEISQSEPMMSSPNATASASAQRSSTPVYVQHNLPDYDDGLVHSHVWASAANSR